MSARMIVKIRTSGNSSCSSCSHTFITANKATYIITITVIPFAPSAARESTYKIAAATIPWFGNDLCFGKNRIFRNSIRKEWKSLHISILIATKRCRKVKAKTIYMHFRYPIVQTIKNQAGNNRMGSIHCVAAARKVHIVLFFIMRKHIVNGIIKSTETECIATFVSFRSMVIYNIKNDFYACLVQGTYHFLKFTNRTTRCFV